MLPHESFIVAHHKDDRDQGWSEEPVNHRGPEEQPDGTDAGERQRHAQEHRDAHHRVEPLGACWPRAHSAGPSGGLCHSEGSGAAEDGNTQQPRPDDAYRKQERGDVAGKRPQRPGRILSRLDMILAICVERRSRGQDDEVKDEVG